MLGGRTFDKDDIQGILLNYRQKDPYTGNFFIGAITDMDWTGGNRRIIRWHPLLADTPEESQQVQDVRPKASSVTDFPQGSIEKHFSIYKVFPDNWKHAPNKVKKTDYGAVIQVLREDMKMKEQQLEQTEQKLEGMKEMMADTQDLDEDLRERFLEEMNEAINIVNKRRSRRDRKNRS